MKSLYRDRLLTMYNYALSKALCHSRKGFAELIGIAPNNLSNAFSDSLHERYCTKSLLLKANEALNNIFSTQWLLTGEGEVYVKSFTIDNKTTISINEHEKGDRLKKMYDYARAKNFCSNKSTFAELVGFAPTNISRAFNGAPRYLTDNLLLRANEALGNAFSRQWLLKGEGEIYAANQDTIVEQNNDEIKLLKKRIEELEAWNWSLLKLAKLLDQQLEEIKKQN